MYKQVEIFFPDQYCQKAFATYAMTTPTGEAEVLRALLDNVPEDAVIMYRNKVSHLPNCDKLLTASMPNAVYWTRVGQRPPCPILPSKRRELDQIG
jgi:hypothetical protein